MKAAVQKLFCLECKACSSLINFQRHVKLTCQDRKVGDNTRVNQTTSFSNSWVVRPRPNPQARLRLFCFPYAGGGASAFYAWVNNLPRNVELCPIQLPGRQGRLDVPPFTRMEALLDALVPVIRPYLDRPFAFFGHSLGAKIGFELARRLRAEGDPMPVHLFLSGSNAPQIAGPESPIHDLPDAELVEKLRRFAGTPEALLENEDLLRVFLPTLRADIALHDTYRYVPEEPLDCSLSAFGGLEDAVVSRDNLEAWRVHTRGAFTLRMFPGDHFFLRGARMPLLRAIFRGLRL
ncbi:MAG: thioesterase [Anaerolineae bacterium]|nr:thioesterase [Anaerolineae bacterium]